MIKPAYKIKIIQRKKKEHLHVNLMVTTNQKSGIDMLKITR